MVCHLFSKPAFFCPRTLVIFGKIEKCLSRSSSSRRREHQENSASLWLLDLGKMQQVSLSTVTDSTQRWTATLSKNIDASTIQLCSHGCMPWRGGFLQKAWWVQRRRWTLQTFWAFYWNYQCWDLKRNSKKAGELWSASTAPGEYSLQENTGEYSGPQRNTLKADAIRTAAAHLTVSETINGIFVTIWLNDFTEFFLEI